MKKIRIKLNKVGLHGYARGATIEVDPTDRYWSRRLAECKGTDYIEILPEATDESKTVTKKSKPNKES